jgi:hypothetical protein
LTKRERKKSEEHQSPQFPIVHSLKDDPGRKSPEELKVGQLWSWWTGHRVESKNWINYILFKKERK